MKVYILLGFLGAGKTTLLKKMLMEKKYFSNVAVIINEFGKTSIDSQELMDKRIALKEITGGSIFCACKFDKFVTTMMELYKTNIEGIVVESSGFSNPTSLHKVIVDLRNLGYKIEPVYISVVDAVKYLKLRKTLDLIDNQVKYSNAIIINKIDLVSEDIIMEIHSTIKEMNSIATIFDAINCEIDIKNLIENYSEINNSEFTYVLNKNIDFSSLELKFKKDVKLLQIIERLKQISDKVFRAKGYVDCCEGKYIIEISSGLVTYEKRVDGVGNFVVLYSTKEVGKNEIISTLNELLDLS